MGYALDRRIAGSMDDVVARVKDALKSEGFGVLTDIDIAATLKAKLGADFRPYRILGACNPPLALRALQAEPRIGVMLPCNVIVRKTGDDEVEVAAIDPVATMAAVNNPDLEKIAREVEILLKRVLEKV